MNKRNVTFFQIGKGNLCLVKIDSMNIVFDLHGMEDKTSFELLKPFLPEKNGKLHLDVLCISHGDQDHCGGFADFREEMEEEHLIIGSIWHPNFDRTKVQGVKDLPEDYLALHEEILRRRRVGSRKYGDIEVPLTAWDDESVAFEGLAVPQGFSLRVLSPYIKDEGDTDWDVNDISLVVKITVSGLSILFPGDSGSKIWQERIIPYTLKQDSKKKWARAHLFVASHHGSFTFFGKTRDEVRDANPYPENYRALDYIQPDFLIVSADSRFPTHSDSSGDQPPHYAAWKWYHKWFRDNRDVKEDNKHPDCFKYTSDGHVRLEHTDEKWEWVEDWTPDDEGSDDSDEEVKKGFVYHGGETRRGGSHYA